MNNTVFEKTMENMRKHRDINLVTREKNKLFGVRIKLSYYKVFHRKFGSYRNEKILKLNKPVYLRLSILELSKIFMYEFCYDYVNPKCGGKSNWINER